MSADEIRTAARETVATSRAAQGFGPTVDDPQALGVVAGLLAVIPTGQEARHG